MDLKLLPCPFCGGTARACDLARIRAAVAQMLRSAGDVFGPRWEQIDRGERNEIILDRWLETMDDLRADLAAVREAMEKP